ncbi:MAG: response regulator [Deltaproteobacteria bacterium]|nr:response regulator [Deltaproteobacteria bacterium]
MIDYTRILVIDSDTRARSRIREIMSAYPYSLEEASDGVEGLQKLIRFQPDLVLAATELPRMDGLHLCRQLRMIPSMQEIPLILMAAEQKDLCTLEGLQSGADDLIAKPVERLDLLARVERQLELWERFARLSSEREGLYLIQEMIHSLYAKETVHDMLFTLVLNVAEIMGVDRCSFVRVYEDRKTGIVEASSDNPALQHLKIDLQRYPEMIEVLNSREMLVIPDVGTEPIMVFVRRYLKETPYRSLVLVPVLAEDESVGTLLLCSARSNTPFTEQEIWFLETLVTAARPVIEHLLRNENNRGDFQVHEEEEVDWAFAGADNTQAMMEEVFRIKGGIDRLKKLREKLHRQNISRLSRK